MKPKTTMGKKDKTKKIKVWELSIVAGFLRGRSDFEEDPFIAYRFKQFSKLIQQYVEQEISKPQPKESVCKRTSCEVENHHGCLAPQSEDPWTAHRTFVPELPKEIPAWTVDEPFGEAINELISTMNAIIYYLKSREGALDEWQKNLELAFKSNPKEK